MIDELDAELEASGSTSLFKPDSGFLADEARPEFLGSTELELLLALDRKTLAVRMDSEALWTTAPEHL